MRTTASGVTLIETIIVLMIIAVLAGFSALLGIRSLNVQEIERVRETIRHELAAARVDTISGTRDGAWGVRFTENGFTRFQGDSYATRNEIYDRPISFGNDVVISGTSEIDFTRPFGIPVASGTVTVADGIRQFTIVVNGLGSIQVQ